MTRPAYRTARRPSSLTAALAAGALLFAQATSGQQPTITPNYKDADIRQVIEAVGEVTGKNFILDPRVKAQVTMLSSSPMSPDAFYAAFLSLLSVYGFVAVPSGDVIKILPDANARQQPGAELDGGRERPDDIVTRVIAVKKVAAAQLVPILRPLIPQYGHLAAHPPSNILIISDRASNVDRMTRIIARIDQAADQDYEILRLEHASASEIVKIIGALNQGAQQAEGGGGPRVTVVADERTNSLLITGDKNERLRYRARVTHLDTPLEEGGDTQVRYLRYADAKGLATQLQSQFTGGGGGGGAPAKDGAAAPPSQRGDISIWADEGTNALIITAPPKVMRSMNSVIDKLDIRRLQVLVEAVIVEISSDRASDLGITWAIGDRDLDNLVGVTKFPGTTGVTGVAAGIIGGGSGGGSGSGSGSGGAATNPATLLRNGLSMGVGRLSNSGISFVALIEALESDGNSNIIGTPVLVTLDNEEAEIKVGQEVPFVTGQFTNTGAQTGATVNPFQTIQRQQVGLTLKLTPQINEGNAVLLKIQQEVSNLLPTSAAVDLITANRNINTTVIVENSATLVLGGLIEDRLSESQSRVPILGRIPLLGALFRADNNRKSKTNLMVFIRPTILTNDVQAAFETNAKYNYIRDQQLAISPGRPRLMPLTPRDILPPIEQQIRESPGTIDLRSLRGIDGTLQAPAGTDAPADAVPEQAAP
ncbi:MAG: type II secretion system secretin GspD [Chromatiales bacterium]|nr:type II secretion system secretin GspD [Chromatiales bacterium]